MFRYIRLNVFDNLATKSQLLRSKHIDIIVNVGNFYPLLTTKFHSDSYINSYLR